MDKRKEEVQMWLGVGRVSEANSEGSIRGGNWLLG